ncbi:MAG: O-methyltransferase [Bacteroidales bacterium]|nr:O-methyltransferase [Bacteroidales bacterium]
MNFLDYSTYLTSPELKVLQELTRETNLKVLMPRMLSGHFQGVLLQFISKMLNPKLVVELGTYTGYSAICLALGLSKNGKLITIEKNDELFFIAQKYFKKSELDKKIEQIFGDALKIIPSLPNFIDLVFIDADKREYLNYYETVLPKVRQGGYILADNVFWNGKIFNRIDNNDEYSKGVIMFNEFVKNDSRVDLITLPIRDGLMILRKK